MSRAGCLLATNESVESPFTRHLRLRDQLADVVTSLVRRRSSAMVLSSKRIEQRIFSYWTVELAGHGETPSLAVWE